MLEKELKIAEELAFLAGALALRLQASLEVHNKPDGLGPVSNADIAADKLITNGLLKNFPDDQIVSEESFVGEEVKDDAQRVWFVDPIDGTKSYILGHSDFVVMIGLAINATPVLGVVYQPTKDIMWSGVKSQSGDYSQCYKIEGGKRSLQGPTEIKNYSLGDLSLAVSRTSQSKKNMALIEYLAPKNVIYQSSVGLKTMEVVEAKADLYVCWSSQVKLWDTCGPAAIARASGIFMGTLMGQPLSFKGSISHQQAVVTTRLSQNPELFKLLNDIDQRVIVAH
jgi:3'(2'), 5'-bisphosphate nucleotidase